MQFFRFEDPWLLLLLTLVPVIIYLYYKGYGRGRVKFSSLHNLKQLKTSRSIYFRHILIGMRSLCITLLILALARPQSGNKTTEYISEGVDIILCLDTSGSMQALDFKLNGERVDRLSVVKNVVENFIKGRKSDRIGMVVFGEEAFTQCPLTLDYGVLVTFLRQVKIGMAGDATAVGSALGTAVKRLKDLQAKSRIVILLTDGRNNSGRINPATAAEIAKKFNIKVYTIGVGTEGEAPFLVEHPLFGKHYVYQRVDLDEASMKEIANITGGMYFRAMDTKALESIYEKIDEMEKTEIKVKEYMEFNELFWWFLLPALLLLVIEIILSQTRFRKIP
ncbi:MAG: vWA domain-containing protein [bacterium]